MGTPSREEVIERIQTYQRELRENEISYDAHVNLIKAFRDLYLLNLEESKTNEDVESTNGDSHSAHVSFMKLRNARKKMNFIYPFSEELWLEWINDELGLGSGKVDEKLIQDLFSKATADYITVKIWRLYIEYKIKLMGDSNSMIEGVRELFEDAITNVGLHFTEGSSVWDDYISFERNLLDKMRSGGDSIKTDVKRQLTRVARLLQRKLSVPLSNHSQHYKDALVFLHSNQEVRDVMSEEALKMAHDRTNIIVEEILPFESDLQHDKSDTTLLLKHYYLYISFEMKKHSKSSFDPARIQCIFERAVRDFCLDPQLWFVYITFLEDVLRIESIITSCCKRALRNVTWDSELLIKCLQVFESNKLRASMIYDTYEQSLDKNHFTAVDKSKIWIAYISFERRTATKDLGIQNEKVKSKIRSLLSRALSQLEVMENCDQALVEFLTFWTEVERCWFHDNERVKQIWKYACYTYNYYSVLTSGINFARSIDDVQLTRLFFNIAVNYDKVNVSNHCQSWVTFESIHGSLESLCEVYKLFRIPVDGLDMHGVGKKKSALGTFQQISDFKLRKMRDSLFQTSEHDKELERKRKIQNHDFGGTEVDKKKIRRDVSNLTIGPQIPSGAEVIGPQIPIDNSQIGPQVPPGVQVIGPQIPPGFQDESNSDDSDDTEDELMETGEENLGKNKDNMDASLSASQVPSNNKMREEPSSKGNSNKDANSNTIYVSNLYPAVTEGELKDLFNSVGKVETVDLHKMSGGKIFAFVTFSTAEEAKNAFRLEHTPLNNRPVYITEFNKGSGRNSKSHVGGALRYTQNLEKTKLFVTNLPKTIRQIDLEQIFNRHQDMKSLRLVNRKGPKQRVFAYVEYSTEEDAARALTETDGRFLKGCTIRVRYSDPSISSSERNESDGRPFQTTRSPEPRFPARKPNAAFVPFQAQNPRKPKIQVPTQRLQFIPASVQRTTVQPKQTPMETDAQSQSEATTSTMSNSDFRKMFDKSEDTKTETKD